jgi:hypothetical protein
MIDPDADLLSGDKASFHEMGFKDLLGQVLFHGSLPAFTRGSDSIGTLMLHFFKYMGKTCVMTSSN